MTRRKLNILLSVFSIVLSFSLFGFGVYASTTVNSSINNTFIYQVPDEDFYVKIVGNIIGCKNQENFEDFLVHEKESMVTSYPNQYDVEFSNIGNKDIVFTFNICNYNTFAINATIISNTSSQNFSSTTSQPITLQAYSYNQQTNKYECDEGVLMLTLKLTTQDPFEAELNSFSIVFEIVQ